MSVTDGARSASPPFASDAAPAHALGIVDGSSRKLRQSGSGTAAPTHDSIVVPPGSPAPAFASASTPGRSRSRNSPMPPRTTPIVVR